MALFWASGYMQPDWSGMFDLVAESVFLRDLYGRITVWNAASEALYGYPRSVAVGCLAAELLKSASPEPIATLLEAGRWEGEVRRVSAKGDELAILARWTLREGLDGAPAQIVETGRDVTASKAFEEKLRYSEHRYHNLFRAMAASFWELDFFPVDAMLRALRKSGVEDFGRYFADNPDFVREMMRATRVVDVNDQTVALFGRGDKAELLGSVEPFWPEESTQVYARGILSGMMRKPHYSTECKLRRIDGSTFDALFTAAFPLETMGKGSLLIGVIDITERQQAFAALQRSEQRYRDLFEHMPIPLWQMNSSGLIDLLAGLRAEGVTDLSSHIDAHPDFVSRAMAATRVEEINLRTVELFGGREKADLLVPAERFWQSRPDTYRKILASRWRGDAVFEGETAMNTLDGRPIEGLITVAFPPTLTAQGISLNGFVDMTARNQSIQALRESETRFRTLFEGTSVSMWRIDTRETSRLLAELRAEGVTELSDHIDAHPDFLARALDVTLAADVNDKTLQLFGATDRSQLLGPIAPLFTPAGRQVFRRALEAAYRGEHGYQAETTFRTLDGREIAVLYTSSTTPELLERGIALVSMVDIGDRVRAQEMLQRVQADFAHSARVSMLGELTASIAHEVNQPLGAIVTNGEAGLRWLSRAEPDVAEVLELTGYIVADARRAAEIISRVRSMAVRRTPEKALVALDEVIEETLLFLRHEIEMRSVSVARDLTPGLPPLMADRTQLQQVIANLAVNAMQAMAQAGSARKAVTIRTAAAGPGALTCCVEDSGPGIPEQHLPRLFESFFTTKEAGMGMGLPICRSIIEAHGGAISARNTAEGGASFCFTLPAATA